jgi:hypothetical protein
MQRTFSFSKALELLKEGRKVARNGWNGKGLWIEMQRPDAYSKMTLPYLYLNYPQGNRVPWLASQTDLICEDWYEVKDEH